MKKTIGILLGMAIFSQPTYALKLENNSLQLPKVKYSELKSFGLSDSEELRRKAVIKGLLSQPSKANILQDPTNVDSETFSFVQELKLENDGWNIRLLKSKARMAIFNSVKANWKDISLSTINISGSENFSHYAPFLKEYLRDDLSVHAHSSNWIIFKMKWAKIKIVKNSNKAHIVIQQDYLADSNNLEDIAYKVQADASTSMVNKKKKGNSSGSSSDSKKTLFSF